MIVLIRGGGDLASGVALRLHRAGLRVVITELAQPLSVRRLVSFGEAIYAGEISVEGVVGRRVADPSDTLRILQVFAKGHIPVLVDSQAESVKSLHPTVVVDARMTKRQAELLPTPVSLIVGLGPGFVVGENCHAVVETLRGFHLGRVYWQGTAQADTRLPDPVDKQSGERVLRAPADGVLEARAEIGEHVEAGQPVAEVAGQVIVAPFSGVLRGLLHSGLGVRVGLKIGDVDPRDDPNYCTLVSDKALAVAGGVLEAILARQELRATLYV